MSENVFDKASFDESPQFEMTEDGTLLAVDSKGNKEDGTTAEPENPGDPTSPENSSHSPLLKSFASALVTEGRLKFIDQEEIEKLDSMEGLASLLDQELSKREYANLSDSQKRVLDAFKNGIPESEIVETSKTEVKYNDVNRESLESNEKLVDTVLEDYYKTFTKFDEEEIKDEITKLKDLALDVDKAETYVNKLKAHNQNLLDKKIEAEKARRAAQEKAMSESIDKLKDKVHSTEQIIDGVKLTEKTREEVFNSMVKPVTNVNGTEMNEVFNSYYTDEDYQIKLHYFHVLTKGFTDFSNVNKVAKSNSLKDIDEQLRKQALQDEYNAGEYHIPSKERSKTINDGLSIIKKSLSQRNYA